MRGLFEIKNNNHYAQTENEGYDDKQKEMESKTNGNKVTGKNVYIYREPAGYRQSRGSCNKGIAVVKLC